MSARALCAVDSALCALAVCLFVGSVLDLCHKKKKTSVLVFFFDIIKNDVDENRSYIINR